MHAYFFAATRPGPGAPFPWRRPKMLACALMAVAFTAHRGRRNAAVLRGFLHAGVVAGLSGGRTARPLRCHTT